MRLGKLLERNPNNRGFVQYFQTNASGRLFRFCFYDFVWNFENLDTVMSSTPKLAGPTSLRNRVIGLATSQRFFSYVGFINMKQLEFI
ncbi:unnamed protein product [Litomosoides sigmodontis]|uniref:Uncharacterized protein n=1 Tax=Litomosoides sigmodontis TaxID=42156 RepID=A0A3P6U4W4_LITSI|nr:unnamed protein product [Litomosoides sigmodontis]